jgi:NAD(P)-dependent dehydrogenase (short-subunit alcohol dehydrogenase family)
MAQYAIDNIVNKTKVTAEEAKKYLESQSPQQRMVTVEEIAALALLLASEEGRGINAQSINIDGGGVQH